MEIIIHQAILHVLDTTMDAPVLSGGPMELTAEKNAYLQNHIEKLLASDDIRQCRPLPDSAFKNELEHNQDFVDLSCRIAGVLFDYMHAHTTLKSLVTIPPSPGQTLPWWILPGTVRRGWAF